MTPLFCQQSIIMPFSYLQLHSFSCLFVDNLCIQNKTLKASESSIKLFAGGDCLVSALIAQDRYHRYQDGRRVYPG